MKRHTFCAAALAVAMLAPALHAQQKRPVDRADQLPLHSYAVTKAQSALLHDEAALAALAAAVRADLEGDLVAYDIRDPSTLRSYYRALSTIDRHAPAPAGRGPQQVVNLATKLLAGYPRLSATEVKRLILDGTDTKAVSGRRTIRLLNEARSFELARLATISVSPVNSVSVGLPN